MTSLNDPVTDCQAGAAAARAAMKATRAEVSPAAARKACSHDAAAVVEATPTFMTDLPSAATIVIVAAGTPSFAGGPEGVTIAPRSPKLPVGLEAEPGVDSPSNHARRDPDNTPNADFQVCQRAHRDKFAIVQELQRTHLAPTRQKKKRPIEK